MNHFKKRSPNPTDVAVGARIRARRQFLGLSQTDLGDALDLTFQQVQKYEKGTNRIGASRLVQIAESLTTSPAALLGDTGKDAKGSNDMALLIAGPDAVPMLRAFAKLDDPTLRRRIVDLVEQIVA